MLAEKYRDALLHDLTAFGGLFFYGLVLGIFVVIGDLVQSYRMIAGLVLIYAIAILIRTFYFKYRPSQQKFGNFVERLDASSFPSVHAARGAFVSLILGAMFPDVLLLRVIFFGVALLNGASRVYLKEHDWFDVVGGVILGCIIAFFALRFV